MIAFVFPGQGAQKIGMAQDFVENDALCASMLGEASVACECDMEKLLFEENEDINITEFTQPALVTACSVMAEYLVMQGIKPDCTAGLSLGEYSALVSSGAMSFNDAVRLARIRGRLMSESVPAGEGGMAAIIGLSSDQVNAVVDGIEDCYVANYNCPGQIVITGRKEAVEKGCELLKEAGARKTVELNVSGPFHSPMLEEAAFEFGGILNEVKLVKPVIPYYANYSAQKITDAEFIRDLLVRQIYSPVRWDDTLRNMHKDGVNLFIEVGPGKTLANFVRKTLPGVSVVNFRTLEDMDAVRQAVSEI